LKDLDGISQITVMLSQQLGARIKDVLSLIQLVLISPQNKPVLKSSVPLWVLKQFPLPSEVLECVSMTLSLHKLFPVTLTIGEMAQKFTILFLTTALGLVLTVIRTAKIVTIKMHNTHSCRAMSIMVMEVRAFLEHWVLAAQVSVLLLVIASRQIVWLRLEELTNYKSCLAPVPSQHAQL